MNAMTQGQSITALTMALVGATLAAADAPVVIVGPVPYPEYLRKCEQAAAPTTLFLERLPAALLHSALAAARVGARGAGSASDIARKFGLCAGHSANHLWRHWCEGVGLHRYCGGGWQC